MGLSTEVLYNVLRCVFFCVVCLVIHLQNAKYNVLADQWETGKMDYREPMLSKRLRNVIVKTGTSF